MANKWTSKPPLGTPIIPSWRTDPQYLKLWLPFQEGGGGKAYDLSGNRNHGTLTNMDNPPTATSGWAGQGLRFDGVNDYVSISNSVVLRTTSFTYSAWVNVKGSHGGGYGGVFEYIGGDTTDQSRFVITNAGSIVIQGNSGSNFNGNTTLSNNKWYFLTLTFNNGISTLYVNGNYDNSTTLVGWTTGIHNILIGTGADWFPTYYFNGLIDDVRIYNRALSAGEVRELYIDRYGDFKPPRNYFLNTGTLFEATIYDTIAVTESLNKQSNIQQSDSITLAEMIRLAIDIEKQDTFEVGDSLSYFITRFQTIMDTIEITELISRQSVELVKSDSVTMIDSLVKDMDISVNDSIEIVDSLTKQVNLIISDSVSLSDGTITKQISISINDIITIIDSLSKIIDVNLDDSVELIENLTKFIAYVMPVTDTIEVTDLISGQNITIVRSDTIEMIDNVEKSITLTLEDNISLTDIIQLLIQLNLDGDSFSITVADPAIIVATRRFRITVNIKKGQTTIEKL
jgi:hypothetical protein